MLAGEHASLEIRWQRTVRTFPSTDSIERFERTVKSNFRCTAPFDSLSSVDHKRLPAKGKFERISKLLFQSDRSIATELTSFVLSARMFAAQRPETV